MTDINKYEEKFLKVMNKNRVSIMKICRVYSYNKEDREDLFQEIAFEIWRSLLSFKEKSSISTWVYRIALNVSLRFAQSNKIKQSEEIDELKVFSSIDRDTQKVMEQNEEIELLYRCIYQLNDVDKSVIILYLEELSYQQIGEIIGLTESNVGVKINRIKQKLFKCLKQN